MTVKEFVCDNCGSKVIGDLDSFKPMRIRRVTCACGNWIQVS